MRPEINIYLEYMKPAASKNWRFYFNDTKEIIHSVYKQVFDFQTAEKSLKKG